MNVAVPVPVSATATVPPSTAWIAECFAASPDLVALVDPSGRVVAANRGDPAPADAADRFASSSRAELRAAMRRVAGSRQPAILDVAGPRRDRTAGWHRVTLTPVVRDGAVEALVLVAADITERVAEEQRLRRGEALMVDTQGVAHLGLWEWDITQPHAQWSAELYRIYGLDPKTHVPTYEDYLTRVHPDDRQRVMDATNEVFHHQQPYSHDERILRSDGSLRYLHTWARPVLDENGKLIRLAGVCQDITDRKLAEIQLEEHAAQLARSNAELEQFARLASHDLQEPLRAVGSYVQLLAQRYRGRLDDAADEAIGFAVAGVHRMKALLEDLLEYSGIASRRGISGPVDLQAVLDKATAALQPEITASGACIRSGPLPAVRGDGGESATLLEHLLANAIKFRGPEAPRIGVQAQARDGFCEVTVHDNGIGIDEAHFQRIFVVFQRLNPEMAGTGIGLAICRKVAERHGGRIWVESQPGRGSTFHFTLPAA